MAQVPAATAGQVIGRPLNAEAAVDLSGLLICRPLRAWRRQGAKAMRGAPNHARSSDTLLLFPPMPEPLLLSTWSFGLRGNVAAWPALAAGGSSLDAVETVCRVVEADEEVDSVGYGGLPDSDGTVSLDGCIMLSPARCGSVCAIRRHLHPVSIARAVMERTGCVMLAGEGADAFAAAQGFEAAELLAESAQTRWRQWKDRPKVIDQSRDRGYAPPPPEGARGGSASEPSDGSTGRDGALPPGAHDTIAAVALDRQGVLAGACSSSGLPFKLPGRVGDSPLIGHGVYVDPIHGAAVATGEGELIMGLCSSFLVVEQMRRGAAPLDAIVEALERYRSSYQLREHHQVALLALKRDGQWAAGALRSGYKTSVTSATRSEVVDPGAVILAD
jgi:N4-(beta-N-acetylglucosaminyl)-L-asparaginase